MKNDQFELCSIQQLNYAGAECDNELKEYGIKLFQSDLSLKRIEGILEEQYITLKKVEKCKEALTTLSQEFNNVVQNPNMKELDTQLQKRTKKLKQVKEDNRKLRQLLKAQLENSEKIRIETQTTVETLREEFDLLVRELSNIQKKEIDGIPNGNQQAQNQQNNIQPLNNKQISQQNNQPFQQQQYQSQQQTQQQQVNGNNFIQNQNVQQIQNQQRKQQPGVIQQQVQPLNQQQLQNFKIQQPQQQFQQQSDQNRLPIQASNQGGQQQFQQQIYNQEYNQQVIPTQKINQSQNMSPQIQQPDHPSKIVQIGSFGQQNNMNNNNSNNSNINNNNQHSPFQVKQQNVNNYV